MSLFTLFTHKPLRQCIKLFVLSTLASSVMALDASGHKTSNKYFHESISRGHSDARFDQGPLSYEARREGLSALITAYLSTMNDMGTETWLMHGSLLGWYWNRKILPWDVDLDVQITEKSMQHLSDHYNMTIHHFDSSQSEFGRDYLLEVNPNWTNSSTADVENKIDARWIDISTGLYVDITTLHRDQQGEASGVNGVLMCKDKHRYKHSDIFPLRQTTFEDVAAKVPFAFANVLVEEYGSLALTTTVFEGHRFDYGLREWVPSLTS